MDLGDPCYTGHLCLSPGPAPEWQASLDLILALLPFLRFSSRIGLDYSGKAQALPILLILLSSQGPEGGVSNRCPVSGGGGRHCAIFFPFLVTVLP